MIKNPTVPPAFRIPHKLSFDSEFGEDDSATPRSVGGAATVSGTFNPGDAMESGLAVGAWATGGGPEGAEEPLFSAAVPGGGSGKIGADSRLPAIKAPTRAATG
ncbi:hypothetical protein JCM17478_15580 [Thermopirellula anaerolimosa]